PRVGAPGRGGGAPAATRTRGLITVESAPVSSRRVALVLPLIFTSTRICLPGVYLMVVPPLGALATGPGAGRPGVVAGGVTAGVVRSGGSLSGTARSRHSCGTLSMRST